MARPDVHYDLIEGDEVLTEAFAGLVVEGTLPDWPTPKATPLLENPFLSGPQKFEVMIALFANTERISLWPDTLTQLSPRG